MPDFDTVQYLNGVVRPPLLKAALATAAHRGSSDTSSFAEALRNESK
jgi:hypothetical protein